MSLGASGFFLFSLSQFSVWQPPATLNKPSTLQPHPTEGSGERGTEDTEGTREGRAKAGGEACHFEDLECKPQAGSPSGHLFRTDVEQPVRIAAACHAVDVCRRMQSCSTNTHDVLHVEQKSDTVIHSAHCVAKCVSCAGSQDVVFLWISGEI